MYKLTQATTTTTHAPERVPRVPHPSSYPLPSLRSECLRHVLRTHSELFFFGYAKTPQNFSQGGISKLGFVWWAS